MSFVSFADASRQLGIDAKTLRRWLAAAQLPLVSHAQDGRKKGLRLDHLHQLARLHHRALPAPALPSAAQAQATLPADLLALPQQLAGLQAQLSTLQQQVTELGLLLRSDAPAPQSPLAASKLSPRRKRSAQPAPAAAPSTAVTALRKPIHVIPRVEYGSEGHYVVICPRHGLLPFEPDSPQWFAWLAQQESFRFVGKEGHFSAHHWWRVPTGAWRAHRKLRNHTANLRLAPTPQLTVAVLEQAAAQFQAQLH